MQTNNTDPTLDPVKGQKLYQAWMGQIQNALEREKDYRKLGQQCVDLYEAKEPDQTPFAILYSNVETLAPAVYNSRPIPIVQRRFKDADPLGKAVCDVSTRMLKYLIDVDSQSYDSFDELMQPAVLDALITDRGLTRFKFVAQDGKMTECVYGEAVRWDKFFHGYARTWKKVPWIGFEWDMTPDELRKNFPDAKLDLKAYQAETDGETDSEGKKQALKGVTLIKVFEIWDKRTRKVMFFSACCPNGPLRMVDDPFGLLGFFPIPKPLNFMRKVTTLVPTPLYEHYKQQARELNDITRRLKAIIKAIRFRGAYNSAVEGIEDMLNAEDNQLVPVQNMASMPDNTGMDKILWIVPINDLAQTAQQLYQQREQVKQVIYEITGISDILRGASVASETATAQNIKNQWGTLRLKKMQKEVQRYCRDSLAIILEIASKRLELSTIKAMTGAPYIGAQEKAQIEQSLSMAQQQAQLTGQQAPPPPPELVNVLKQPTWEEIYALMQDEMLVSYRTDIETNSTIDAEAAQDKQDIAELLNALSQFLNGLGPLVEKGIMPFDIAKEMLLVISRRYNFGTQLEDAIMGMAAPPPPQEGPDPADQIKLQVAQEEAKLSMQVAQQEAQLGQQEFAHKQKLMAMKMEMEIAELQIKRQELMLQERAVGLKLQQQEAQHRQKMELIAAQTAAAKSKEPADASV